LQVGIAEIIRPPAYRRQAINGGVIFDGIFTVKLVLDNDWGTGIQRILNQLKTLDSGFCRNDETRAKGNFHEFITFDLNKKGEVMGPPLSIQINWIMELPFRELRPAPGSTQSVLFPLFNP